MTNVNRQINEWINIDPFMEEEWFDEEGKIQLVAIDANIYF